MVVHDVLDLSGPVYDNAFQMLNKVLRVIHAVEDMLVDDVHGSALLGVHSCPRGLGLTLRLSYCEEMKHCPCENSRFVAILYWRIRASFLISLF